MFLYLKTIKFYLIKLATYFYWQPSYLLGDGASLTKYTKTQGKYNAQRPILANIAV